jgi:hypothetical protein
MTKRQLIGSVGCIILLLGVFAPVVKAPVVGGINYLNDNKTSGTIVLVLAIVSYLLIRFRFIKGLWATGLGSFGVIVVSFIRLQRRLHEVTSSVDSSVAGTPLSGLGDFASKSIRVQWGWAILIIGAALLVLAASMAQPQVKAPPKPE